MSENVIDCYARLRAQLELSGIRIDDIDLLIASTAIFYDLTIVTHNTKHFIRIPGLKIEDWES